MQLYVRGLERMPFQGRYLMVLPMRLFHGVLVTSRLGTLLLQGAMPEEAVRSAVDILSLIVAGYFTVRLYQASSRLRLLTLAVYPVFLAACASTYILRTLQNVRYPYDLPSLAFFSAAFYLMYTRKHWLYFAALFLLATTNRETTLLLLPLYLFNQAFDDQRLRWNWKKQRKALLLVAVLGAAWVAWQLLVRHRFAQNPTEAGRHLSENLYYLHDPHGLVQLLSSGGFLIVAVVVLWRTIPNARLRAWVWLVPLWFCFMFVVGIVVEIRVFGELIPYATVALLLVVEAWLAKRLRVPDSTQALVAETTDLPVGRLNNPWALSLVGAELLLVGIAIFTLVRSEPLPPAISAAGGAVSNSVNGKIQADALGISLQLLHGGQVARALPMLMQVTANDPGNAAGWTALCEAQTRLREYDHALRSCEQAANLNPREASSQNSLKTVRFKLEQRRVAGFSLEEVPPLARDSSFYVSLGRFLMNEDAGEAAQAFAKAVQLDARSGVANTELGTALMLSGRYREAQICFERVAAQDPDNDLIKNDLAWSLEAQKADGF